jgi:hypothetical protein
MGFKSPARRVHHSTVYEDYAPKYMADLRSQLEQIFGKPLPVIEEPPRAKCLPFFRRSINEAFQRYIAECVGRDLEDERQICVTLLEDNFAKLVSLQYRATDGTWRRAKLGKVLPLLRTGALPENGYRCEHPIRLQTLFWIDDTVCNADGIHPNSARLVEGEEMYFKRYARGGSNVKLVFTTIRSGGIRIPVTSFMCEESDLKTYCKLPALWPKNEGHP